MRPFSTRLSAFLLCTAVCANAADFNLSGYLGRLLQQSNLARAMDKVREADDLRAANKLEDALAASAEAAAFGPELPVAQALHGHLLRRLGFLDAAAKHLRHAVETQPDYAAAWLELSLTQLQRNDAEGALAASARLVALMPNDAPAHGMRGAAMLLKKDADGAMHEFTTAIGLDKRYAYAYEGRAAAYEAQSETKSAMEDLTRAYNLSREPLLLLRRAAIKIRRGDKDGALEDYGLVLKAEIDPRMRAGVHLARAQIYQEWKQPARVAQEQAEAAAALRGLPGAPQSLGQSGGLRPPPAAGQPVAVPPEVQRALQLFQQSVANAQRGKLDEAIKQLDEAIKLAPRFAEARVNRGVLLINRGRADAAIADLTRAIEMGLKTPGVYAQRGLSHALKGDCAAAVADLDVALKAEPNQMQWLGWRANCLRRINRFDDARRDLDRVIAADPKFAGAYDERARVFALKGELMLALADAGKQIELTPKNPLAYLLRGAIHHQLNNLQSALVDLTQAIALDPKLALAYQERSVIYMKLNQSDLAAQDQKKLAELSPVPAK
ncbi:MAG: tetratricopeptide repeat protein [Verrucomicrobia bacterium]|nr:tetratricopeptide repeat protein [Verrucomicrobiota bacterium]